jgi:hypothetical protein
MLICHFCGLEITGVLGPDVSEDGRTAHWRCSEAPAYEGSWQSVPIGNAGDSPEESIDLDSIDRACMDVALFQPSIREDS